MKAAAVRVLLVEDSFSDAVLLQESLAQPGLGGFDFTHVECWAEAVQCLRQKQFEVLLLDLSLPDITGRDTFLRARAEAPHLPIVVLTGETNEAVGLEAVRHGIQDYLIKGQAYGRQTARAIRYAIERKQAEETLKRTEEALRSSERQLREWNSELERRVAERTASLEETISDLEDFSHSITHDLRAPLRAIRSFAQILGEECLACGRSRAQEHIERITSAAARMDKLIQDVLQYSRLARSELKLVPVDVQGLLRSIIETYPAFQPPHVEIQIEGPLPRLLGNEAALTQCFSNLLGNAIKFVAPGTRPQVRVWAERVGNPKAEIRNPKEGRRPKSEERHEPLPAETDQLPVTNCQSPATQHATRNTPQPPALHSFNPQGSTLNHMVRLWFADNGVGIPKEAQERIFKMFQRLDKSCDGTGVGLTVVRKAVEKMGGRMGLESEPGRGSRFWVELKGAADQPG
ncbi:MAG: hybrid sensor histidine kinase/response regulator [Verrucomicrobiota bacterium]|jgi:signal transduction histidine kinase